MKSKTHWSVKRKIEDLERMISDVETGRVTIKGRDPEEFLESLRTRIATLTASGRR